KIERRDREDEALERPVLDVVPAPGRREGLLAVDLLGKGDVEAPEIDQLARRVDLRLVNGLRVAEARSRVEDHAIGTGQELRRPEKDPGPVVPGHARPRAVRPERGVDRVRDLGRARLVPDREDVPVIVRHDGLGGPSGHHRPAVDTRCDLGHLARHPGELGPHSLALGAAGGVGQNGLVTRGRHGDDRVRHVVLLALRRALHGHRVVEGPGPLRPATYSATTGTDSPRTVTAPSSRVATTPLTCSYVDSLTMIEAP